MAEIKSFRDKLLNKWMLLEHEALAYIQKAEDGIVLLEELEGKYFCSEKNRKYFNLLKAVHKTTVERPDAEMSIVKEAVNLFNPSCSKDLLLERIKDIWFASTFTDFLDISFNLAKITPYTKMKKVTADFINASFKLLENDSNAEVSTFGDYTFKDIYEESYIAQFGYMALEGLYLRQGSIIVIGGRPGHGKSTFALNLMLKNDLPSAFFSYEMPIKRLQDKLIRAKLNIYPSEVEDKDSEMPFSTESAVLLMKNSPDFDSWITDILGDVENFSQSS